MVFSGRIEQLPGDLSDEISLFEEATSSGDLLTVVICLNYGGRQEIVDAVNGLISSGLQGPVTEDMISSNLYHPWIPDPDLVIRTSGELRISNFLLWGSAYSEFYFTDTLWPDFNGEEFRKALKTTRQGREIWFRLVRRKPPCSKVRKRHRTWYGSSWRDLPRQPLLVRALFFHLHGFSRGVLPDDQQ